MIKKQSVFILGAGASMPYGFPSGTDLVNKICSKLTNPESFLVSIQGSSIDIPAYQIEKFVTALRFSGKKSVDSFLEKRREFIEIGKLAIATILLPIEKKGGVFSQKVGNRDWYEYFFNYIESSYDYIDQNKFSVITYNYDRSFEQFLLNALKHSSGNSEEKCFEKIKKIPIVHLHGQLGEEDDFRLFKIPKEKQAIERASKGIKIIFEHADTEPQFLKAHNLLNSAEYVFFLGFGYNEVNLRRLGLGKIEGSTKLTGSTYGFTVAEIQRIQRLIKRHVEFDMTGKQNCENFLRNSEYFQGLFTEGD